jgi:hypothetical protein
MSALASSAHAPRGRSLLLAGLLLLTSGAGALAQDGGSSPGDPGTGVPPSPEPMLPVPFVDQATPAVPMPGAIVDPQPIGWDHVTIGPDGRTLTVFFVNGVEACYGLDRVELTDEDGTLRITLFTGFREDAANIRCIELAQLYSIDITLDQPILGGGIEGMDGPAPASDAQPEVLLPGAAVVQPNIQPWEKVQVGPDGTSLWVWFTGGAAPCFALDRVAYEPVDGLPTLSLITGPTDLDMACIAIAVQYATPAAIDAPILLGGMA